MMNDIKACFQLLKHGYQLKTNVVCGLIFGAIGIPFILVGYDRLPLCALYFFLANLFLSQSMYMMLFSGHVGASPRRKKLEFLYLDILSTFGGIVAVVLTLILAFLAKPEQLEGTSTEAMLVISGLMAIVMYCYMSVGFKAMFLGFVTFFVSFLYIMSMPYGKINDILCQVLQGKTAVAVIIFLAEVVLGIVLGHGLRKLMYRRDMSKWAAGSKLRMEQ